MKWILIRWLILTASITLASYLMDGIHIEGFKSALLASAVLGLLNAFFRPILIILTLPINILSLGLFTFVINAMLLRMASGLINGFEVHGFWAAVIGSLIISIINWLLSSFVNEGGRGQVRGRGRVNIRGRSRGQGRMKSGDYIDLEQKDEGKWE